jgi:hypothetical protein
MEDLIIRLLNSTSFANSSFRRNGKLPQQYVSRFPPYTSSYCLITLSFTFSGVFEPPGSHALAAFVAESDLAAERAKKDVAASRVPAGEVESSSASEQEQGS